MESLLLAEDLTKTYGLTVAVSSVSCSIRRGAITALVGGNGAGKSVLTRLLSGAARPDKGKFAVSWRKSAGKSR
jgi:ABC-type sugar transport system ATPase subunit